MLVWTFTFLMSEIVMISTHNYVFMCSAVLKSKLSLLTFLIALICLGTFSFAIVFSSLACAGAIRLFSTSRSGHFCFLGFVFAMSVVTDFASFLRFHLKHC